MATRTTETADTPAQARREVERTQPTVAPRVDIYETDKTYVVLADMPAVTPEGVDVVAEGETLILRGRAQMPANEPTYQEYQLADYYRAFTLTEDLDTDGVTATLRDGVLRVEIPKSPRVQPKRIPVRTE